MTGCLYLAVRYLAYHRVKSMVLIVVICLIAYLPLGLKSLLESAASQLTARAATTPLLIGASGSPLELVMNALYFSSDPPPRLTYGEVQKIMKSELAEPIPLYVRFRARGFPVVGTSLEYFDFRDLKLNSGHWMTVIGECVIGAEVARKLGLSPGDTLSSTPETLFDLAGVYPLKMRVAGVLAPSYTPDDQAVFVDVKTAWVIEGRGHGHRDLALPEASQSVLRREGDRLIANASLVQYNEVKADKQSDFHFHGDIGDNPLTGIIALPRDRKSAVILEGRYSVQHSKQQMVHPILVMEKMLSRVFALQAFMMSTLMVAGLAAFACCLLVFLLSIQLRGTELASLVKVGVARSRLVGILASEVLVVLSIGGGVAVFLAALTGYFSEEVIQLFLLS